MPTNISKTLFAALMATTASFAVASCSEPAAEVSYSQEQIEAESVALYAFFDQVFEEDLQNSPFALALRGSKDRNSEWDDFSEAEQDRQHLQEIDRLVELRAFNFGSLSEEAQLSYRLYQVQAERSISGWDFRYHDYPINQFFGWHTFFPVFMLNIHRVDTVADAEAYQKEVVAEGEGKAIERVFAAIHNGDPTPDLIAIRYLEALSDIADGQATKIFLPMELSGILGSIGAIGEIFQSSDGGASGDRAGS